jgi:undecaprenyl-diphosphatase
VTSVDFNCDSAPPTAPSITSGRHRAARRELISGSVLVLLTAIGGVYFYFRPQPADFDHWIQISPTSGSWFTSVTTLRYPLAVILGSVFFALLTVTRDRVRALACLIGPPLALIAGELVVKPAVGRTIGGLLSYPSGSTVGAAALATAGVLACPRRWRSIAAIAATLFGLWMAVAVVALGWHYPSDAFGGLLFGTGVVLLVDGSATEAHRHLMTTGFGDRTGRSNGP